MNKNNRQLEIMQMDREAFNELNALRNLKAFKTVEFVEYTRLINELDENNLKALTGAISFKSYKRVLNQIKAKIANLKKEIAV